MAILKAAIDLFIQIFYLLEKHELHRGIAGKQIIQSISNLDELR